LAGAAQAAQSEIDLSSLTNANIQTYSDGTNYPIAGSTFSIGAASFSVSSFWAAPTPLERSRSPRQPTAL
jgi:hypothetical protein